RRRLLDEARDPVGAVHRDDAESAWVGDRSERDAEDSPALSVAGGHIGHVDIGDDVAVADKKGLAAIAGRLLHRHARPKGLLFVGVGNAHTEGSAVTERLLDPALRGRGGEDDVVDTVVAQILDQMAYKWAIEDGDES